MLGHELHNLLGAVVSATCLGVELAGRLDRLAPSPPSLC